MPAEDKARMEAILRREVIGHLALADGDELYMVPLNYTYHEGKILFHCSLEGKKLDMIRRNSRVCFEVCHQYADPAEHGPEGCDAPFDSVLCWGTARIIDDLDERKVVLDAFQARYPKPDGSPRGGVPIERVKGCGAVVIRVERMTGRYWAGKVQENWEWASESEGAR